MVHVDVDWMAEVCIRINQIPFLHCTQFSFESGYLQESNNVIKHNFSQHEHLVSMFSNFGLIREFYLTNIITRTLLLQMLQKCFLLFQ